MKGKRTVFLLVLLLLQVKLLQKRRLSSMLS